MPQLPEQIGCEYCFLEKKCSKKGNLCPDFKHFQLITDVKHLLTNEFSATHKCNESNMNELFSSRSVFIWKREGEKLVIRKYGRRGVDANLRQRIKTGKIIKI
jgi:hypothetical protein